MSDTSEIPLAVVIVTYASERLIRPCLSSLLACSPSRGLEVHVLDNDSPDGTVGIIREEFPGVHLTPRRSNDGFAVANNEALSQISNEYALVLNPDTRLEPDTLDHLLARLESDESIGMIGPRLLKADGSLDHAAKRTIPSPGQALKYFVLRAVNRVGSAYVRPDLADTDTDDVDAINGAFMLVRMSAVGAVGLLDESYWMYAEDLDWCLRFRRAGWRVVYDGTVVAHHVKGGSAPGPRRLALNYHFHRSMAVFYRKHQRSNAFVDVAVIGAIWGRFLLSTLAGLIHRLGIRIRPVRYANG